MKERQIIFSVPMVRAILNGRKTQTRRIYKHFVDCPYGPPGTRLWVREAWRADHSFEKHAPREIWPFAKIWYEADGPAPAEFGRYRHARYMPLRQSRITLEVTGVRAERLQDISEDDAYAEGVTHAEYGGVNARDGFRHLWESIYGPGSWAANPWVWVIDFRRLEGEAV